MKHFNEFINESLDNTIFEGFLDKLKDAIENVVDNPKKYIDIAKNQMQDMKDKKYFVYKDKNDIEGVAKELDNLNNDEDLKKIFDYVKNIFKGNDSYLRGGVLGSSGDWPKIFKDVEETFKSDENKTFAIVQIANAIAIAYKEQHQQKSKSSYSHSSNSSSSSRSKRAGAIAGCVAAGMRMRH